MIKAVLNTGELTLNDEYLVHALEKLVDPLIVVNVASKRARELARGSASMVPVKSGQSYLDTALLEIAEGKIVVEDS